MFNIRPGSPLNLMPMTTGYHNDAAKELLAYQGSSDINDDQAAFSLQEHALLPISYEKRDQNQIPTRFLNTKRNSYYRLLKKNNIPIRISKRNRYQLHIFLIGIK